MVKIRFFFALACFVMLSHHAFGLDTQRTFLSFVLTTYPISFSTPVGSCKEILAHKIDVNYSSDPHENTRKLLLLACENYLIVIPKQMGCYLCQLAHALVKSERYQHVQDRKKEVEMLIELLNKKPFSPHEIARYIKDEMEPFAGHYGANFQAQCTIMLQSIDPFCPQTDEHLSSDIP